MYTDGDIQGLEDLAAILLAQLNRVVTEKVAVLTALTALRTGGAPDFKSISEGGSVGSESYTITSLQERFDGLTRAEVELRRTYEEQRLLAIKATPGMGVSRISHHSQLGW